MQRFTDEMTVAAVAAVAADPETKRPGRAALGEVRITSQALNYEASEDLLPEVMSLVGAVVDAAISRGMKLDGSVDVMTLAPALGALASQLGGGRLKVLAGRILAGTQVITKNAAGELDKYDLLDKADRARLFEARPDVYFPTLLFAGRVTFGRFFPASDPPAEPPKAT
jgi:hypothetical protein